MNKLDKTLAFGTCLTTIGCSTTYPFLTAAVVGITYAIAANSCVDIFDGKFLEEQKNEGYKIEGSVDNAIKSSINPFGQFLRECIVLSCFVGAVGAHAINKINDCDNNKTFALPKASAATSIKFNKT